MATLNPAPTLWLASELLFTSLKSILLQKKSPSRCFKKFIILSFAIESAIGLSLVIHLVFELFKTKAYPNTRTHVIIGTVFVVCTELLSIYSESTNIRVKLHEQESLVSNWWEKYRELLRCISFLSGLGSLIFGFQAAARESFELFIIFSLAILSTISIFTFGCVGFTRPYLRMRANMSLALFFTSCVFSVTALLYGDFYRFEIYDDPNSVRPATVGIFLALFSSTTVSLAAIRMPDSAMLGSIHGENVKVLECLGLGMPGPIFLLGISSIGQRDALTMLFAIVTQTIVIVGPLTVSYVCNLFKTVSNTKEADCEGTIEQQAQSNIASIV